MDNQKDIQLFRDFFENHGWQLKWEDERPVREAKYKNVSDIGLHVATAKSLESLNGQVYCHQHEAISRYLSGANIAVTTTTASGKTLIFNTCAIETLCRNPNARIAAIYPLKALANEQENRWRNAVHDAGLDIKVGRIDGDVKPLERRIKLLKSCRVLVFTPDILHAWLFLTISSAPVQEFLRNLSMVILDEAHTYSGVFGSNSAFLFRRILHTNAKLGGKVRFIASSATMSDPQRHMKQLVGEDFEVIDSEFDTSPQRKLHTFYVDPPKTHDLLGVVSDLIHFSAIHTERQSITFVDSRKQTEYLATILDRKLQEAEEDDEETLVISKLKELQIYPYRSGYEADDRQLIQSKLQSGKLRGVVSTSALEMGIDLPYLTLGIIQGIPRSATSYFQRVGRVGRQQDGIVIVINNGSVMSESVFREPERIHSLPLIQSALYLHNPRIQYIHAMCLARQGGEDEIVCNAVGSDADPFASNVDVPADFEKLCKSERIGELTNEFQTMKSQAGDDPYHTFPLRDLDMQFKVEMRHGPNQFTLGSLSYGQVMREAYPGAVYYYQTKAYRVVRIRKAQRTIDVRAEKRYFTSPKMLPTLILPNLTTDNIYQDVQFGSLRVIECAMQIGEALVGFKERRGSNEIDIDYPLRSELGFYYDAPKFARYMFTSGVLFDHPALLRPQVKCDAIARVIYEAFLMTVPFEPQDINAGDDKHRSSREGIKEGARFTCVYDQTYGSLRLTSRLMDESILRGVLKLAVEIGEASDMFALNAESIGTLQEMASDSQIEPKRMETSAVITIDSQYVKIIKPGSYGVDVKKDNEEFIVDAVFFNPQLGELAYRGKHITEQKKADHENKFHGKTSIIVSVSSVQPLEGESTIGYYNYETGEIVDTILEPGEF
ncbi:MAG: DEAD/DEAH box helicase [Nitrospira sp.]|nr:DEAD/DEAH box helicase [Nitrospira sp.]